MSKLRGIFQIKNMLWRGLILVLPLLIILWILFSVLNEFNKFGDKILELFLPGRHLVWGLGVLVIVFFILIIGGLEIYSTKKKSHYGKP